MYLREVGSVELLSREGGIAIAKRIEAGREAMIAGLCESPLTFQAIVIWRDEFNDGKVFLRDIIDLEATYAGPVQELRSPRRPAPVAAMARTTAPSPFAAAPPVEPAAAPAAAPGSRLSARRAQGPTARTARPARPARGRRLRRRRHGEFALARRDRGRAQAQGAGDLRHRRLRLQVAAPCRTRTSRFG